MRKVASGIGGTFVRTARGARYAPFDETTMKGRAPRLHFHQCSGLGKSARRTLHPGQTAADEFVDRQGPKGSPAVAITLAFEVESRLVNRCPHERNASVCSSDWTRRISMFVDRQLPILQARSTIFG